VFQNIQLSTIPLSFSLSSTLPAANSDEVCHALLIIFFILLTHVDNILLDLVRRINYAQKVVQHSTCLCKLLTVYDIVAETAGATT
jgi:hypothetical protein